MLEIACWPGALETHDDCALKESSEERKFAHACMLTSNLTYRARLDAFGAKPGNTWRIVSLRARLCALIKGNHHADEQIMRQGPLQDTPYSTSRSQQESKAFRNWACIEVPLWGLAA